MTSTASKLLFTTPIFYPNDKLHIGHTYTIILTDILTKLSKLINIDSYLLTGLDEHGNKVFNAAKANHYEIMDWLNLQFSKLLKLCNSLNIHIDIESRTTNKTHIKYVQSIWTLLQEKGLIYKDKYSGYYSEKDETFFKEDEIIIKDNKHYTHDGAYVYYLEEECWYLKINKIELKSIIDNLVIYPQNRINELLSILNEDNFGDLCISRKNGWGIQVPNDTSVIYVWLDALTNYISQFDQIGNKDLGNNMVHVVGKDIFKFHGLYWPYIIKQLGYKMPKILVHNWFILDDKKMSKSFNNVIDPMILINKYPFQAIRFYFIYCDLISGDQNFHENDIIKKFNSFIVDKYANLIYRTWVILHKNNYTKHIDEVDNILFVNIDIAIQNLNIKEVLNQLFSICDELNGIFERQKAWLPENIEHTIHIAGQLKKIIKYFDAILGDDKYNTIQFDNPPIHIYKRIEIIENL